MNIPFLEPFKDKFIEIGKSDCNGVSSTQIRTAYSEGRLGEVRSIIPQEIYEYLKDGLKINYSDFDAKKEKERIINWIKEWFDKNGPT